MVLCAFSQDTRVNLSRLRIHPFKGILFQNIFTLRKLTFANGMRSLTTFYFGKFWGVFFFQNELIFLRLTFIKTIFHIDIPILTDESIIFQCAFHFIQSYAS